MAQKHECKKCGSYMPCTITINKKRIYLHNRSYCLQCSPYKEKYGYKLRKQNTRIIRQGNDQKQCPICNKWFNWTKNNICSTCRNRYIRYMNKQYGIQKLGGQCINCGAKDPAILTFHHKDKNEKDFTISCYLHQSRPLLDKELNKCILLCHNCHMKQHSLENQQQLEKIKQYYEAT